jgi:hypothetical protein
VRWPAEGIEQLFNSGIVATLYSPKNSAAGQDIHVFTHFHDLSVAEGKKVVIHIGVGATVRRDADYSAVIETRLSSVSTSGVIVLPPTTILGAR